MLQYKEEAAEYLEASTKEITDLFVRVQKPLPCTVKKTFAVVPASAHQPVTTHIMYI